MAINTYSHWNNPSNLPQRKFVCGYNNCGRLVASAQGWVYQANSNKVEGYIYICPNCHRPTFFDITENPVQQIPGISYGEYVHSLPKQIEDLYSEIRQSTSAGAFTAAVLSCRKMLMHLAVEKGANQGKPFIFYVEYLVDNHFAPPGSKPWVDKIRNTGNEANHEIKIMSQTEAIELINFIEMLLKFIYEFPNKIGIIDNE